MRELDTKMTSTGRVIREGILLITKRKTSCIIDLDLQGSLENSTSEKKTELRSKLRIDGPKFQYGVMHMVKLKRSNIFARHKENQIFTKKKNSHCAQFKKKRHILIQIHAKVEKNIENFLKEDHI